MKTSRDRVDSFSEDIHLIRACREKPTHDAWAAFFEQFEVRFRRWIAGALRDGSAEDREDAYQNVVERLLEGKILHLIDLTTPAGPLPYLKTTVTNVANEFYRHKAHLAEEPLADDDSMSSHLSRLADTAAPVPGDVVLRRLLDGLRKMRIGPEMRLAFEALMESDDIKEVMQKTGFSRATTYRYVRELDQLAHRVLGVAKKRKKDS